MLPSLTALDYVTVGQIISVLRKARYTRALDYASEIDKLLDWLERCEFQATKAVAEGLKAATIPETLGIITDSAARELEAMVSVIARALEHESTTRQVVVLNTRGVSQKLRNLGSNIKLNATQVHLLDETVRCLECAAYRGAAVMGWNLAYDFIRRWMWDDTTRRGSFNAKLTSLNTKAGVPVYASGLATYDEFYTLKPFLGEREVLELMRDAGLLSGVYEKLATYLKDRNSFAHANDLVPGMYQTNHYLEQLVDIITSAPFK
jgi:hypothetical protein